MLPLHHLFSYSYSVLLIGMKDAECQGQVLSAALEVLHILPVMLLILFIFITCIFQRALHMISLIALHVVDILSLILQQFSDCRGSKS